EENGIRLHAGVRVEHIDREAQIVYGQGGVAEPYDHLVLATGSNPFVPPIEGAYTDEGELRDGVFVFRTLEDCERITQHASGSGRAVVIGGGLLGLEAAHGLLEQGVETHVVHLAESLMETQLDPQGGATLQKAMEDMGVHVHLEKMTSAVAGNGHIEGVRFSDGSSLDADMVVISAGIRPNASLARDAGLTVNRGIVVGDDLTSPDDPAISAIGECAEHNGVVYGLVAPAWEQARLLADRLTSAGSEVGYSGSRVSTKLKVMGVDVTVMGEKAPQDDKDEVVSYVEPSRGIYKKMIVREGRLAGAIVVGDGGSAPGLLQAFDRDEVLPENRAEMLFALGGEAAGGSVDTMPDDAQVCNCNGVSKGQIVSAVETGARTLKAVCDATRAGTGCGSCKPQVEALLEFAADGAVEEDPSAHYYVPGVPMDKQELVAAVKEQGLKSVSAVFDALAGGKEDPGSKVGLASLLRTIWGDEYEDERDARFINDRVHANIQKDGTFSVVPRIYGGITTPEQLRRIADVAEKYSVPMVKLTGGQRLDLLGIPKENLPGIWQELGMPSGHAYSKAFRTCKTCVGSEFCRFGVGDSTTLGVDVEKRFQGLETPHKVKLAASGCPRNCAESTTKDVGMVAIEGGRWEVYVGGAAGSRVRKGDVLCVVDSRDEVLKYTGRFLQYYRENARYKERTYDFVERVGIERLKELLVEDAEGICDQLDADMQASVDAYYDPWQEAEDPRHPAQFTSELTGAGARE
ncbi:MAG: nitrite reductase large subunit NirB, partial [Chloroflexota bacterium]